ncbi:hypothetical protein AAVH_10190 [Aphelenchoides avenae]|nr:hypothetical protein AAVH_10190 [Aphelenchus avenae]
MRPLLFVLGLAFVTTVLIANVDAIKCIVEAPEVPRQLMDCSIISIDKCFVGRNPEGHIGRSCGFGYICDNPPPGFYCCNDKDYFNDGDVPAGPPEGAVTPSPPPDVVTPGPASHGGLMCYTGGCDGGQGEAVECPGSVDKCGKCGGRVNKRGCDFAHLCGVVEGIDCCSSDYCNGDETPGPPEVVTPGPPDPPQGFVTPASSSRDGLKCYTGGCDGGKGVALECPGSVGKCGKCGFGVYKRGCDIDHICDVVKEMDCCSSDYCNGDDDNRGIDNNPRSGALASTPPVPLTVAVIATIIASLGI